VKKKIILIVVVFVLLTGFLSYRVKVRQAVRDLFASRLPSPKQAQEFIAGTSTKSTVLPDSINLKIPFVSQAPFADWNMPYQEACEEAAAIMIHRYFTGENLTPKIMDEELLKLIDWENKIFGYYKDTTAAETARILSEYFGHEKVTVQYDFNMDDVRKEVAAGRPVILLAAGKLLGNPNFRNGGPVYHALVIKGYTKDKIITNDPGTRNGADYLYDPSILMNAAHEWNAQNILQGRRAIVIVGE